MEKGRIKVSNKLSGYIKVGKKRYPIPREYDLSPREKYHNKDCEFELNQTGQLIKVLVNGQPLSEDNEKAAEKQKKEERKIAKSKFEEERSEHIKKMGSKFNNDSFNIQECLLPQNTSKVDIHNSEFDNFYLKFHQYARYDERDEKFKFFQKDRKLGDFEITYYSGNFPVEKIAEKQKDYAEKLFPSVSIQEFSTSWRLSVGLGQQSVYETSITLHHIYGIPYIPASSIKGIVRSYIIDKFFERKEEKAIKNKSFCDLFGCPGKLMKEDKNKKKIFHKSYYKEARRGQIVFWDAFPTEQPSLKTDVMNPHYPDYYGKEKPPTDYQNPIPIFFLAVENTKFQFIIGLPFAKKEKENNEEFIINFPEDRVKLDPVEFIEKQLQSALQNHGIGAKTAVGYGYMQ